MLDLLIFHQYYFGGSNDADSQNVEMLHEQDPMLMDDDVPHGYGDFVQPANDDSTTAMQVDVGNMYMSADGTELPHVDGRLNAGATFATTHAVADQVVTSMTTRRPSEGNTLAPIIVGDLFVPQPNTSNNEDSTKQAAIELVAASGAPTRKSIVRTTMKSPRDHAEDASTTEPMQRRAVRRRSNADTKMAV